MNEDQARAKMRNSDLIALKCGAISFAGILVYEICAWQ